MRSLFLRFRGEPLRLTLWSWTIVGAVMGCPVGAGAQWLLPPDDASEPVPPLPAVLSMVEPDAADARTVADRYGFAHWGEVQTLAFSLDLQLNQTERIQREWVWDVKAGRATIRFQEDGAWVEESLDLAGPIATPEDVRNHRRFTYDTYWLLFPFQLMWSDPRVTNEGEQFSAVPGSTYEKLFCLWPTEGGYTPGDAYDLYLYEDHLIRHWIFRRGVGDDQVEAPSVWQGHHQVGPLVMCLAFREYPGDSGFLLRFTDVELTLTDGTVHEPVALPVRETQLFEDDPDEAAVADLDDTPDGDSD